MNDETRHALAIYNALHSRTLEGWGWVMSADTAERMADSLGCPSASREVLTLAAATGQLRMFDMPVRIDENATAITLERPWTANPGSTGTSCTSTSRAGQPTADAGHVAVCEDDR